jgi:hypothetical protein
MKKIVQDLAHNPRNPRSITAAKVTQLGKSMTAFGDISGIVFNNRSGVVIGGTQRTKNLPKTAKVRITKTYAKPTAKGTVAVGYVEHEGERFNYREVSWDENTQEAAMIAANKSAGEWDKTKLTDSMRKLGSFDADFDLELTMFDTEEIRKKFSTVTVSEHQRSNGEDEDTGEDDFVVVPGETYAFGPHRLTVGSGIPAADELFKTWTKTTGERPVLLQSRTDIEDSTEGEGNTVTVLSGPIGEGPKPLVKAKRLKKKPKTIGFAALTGRG